MNKVSTLFVLLHFLFVLTGCNNENKLTESDIEGVWAAVTNDSIYGELIISKNKFHSDDKGEGNLIIVSNYFFSYGNMALRNRLLNFKLENDTLKIYNIDLLIPELTLKKIDKDELHGNLLDASSAYNIKFTRLKEDNEIIRSLLMDTLSWDNNHFQNYITAYKDREEKWNRNNRE